MNLLNKNHWCPPNSGSCKWWLLSRDVSGSDQTCFHQACCVSESLIQNTILKIVIWNESPLRSKELSMHWCCFLVADPQWHTGDDDAGHPNRSIGMVSHSQALICLHSYPMFWDVFWVHGSGAKTSCAFCTHVIVCRLIMQAAHCTLYGLCTSAFFSVLRHLRNQPSLEFDQLDLRGKAVQHCSADPGTRTVQKQVQNGPKVTQSTHLRPFSDWKFPNATTKLSKNVWN